MFMDLVGLPGISLDGQEFDVSRARSEGCRGQEVSDYKANPFRYVVT